MKFFRQKNNIHEGDRENALSLSSNLDLKFHRDNRHRLNRSYKMEEPEVNIGKKALVGLG